MKEKKENQKINRIELIKKHHFILWLILFFPIAIYKSIRYKILPKWGNILLIIFFALLIIISVDTIINPNRVVDNNVNKNLKNYTKDIGSILDIEQYDVIQDYYIYDVITSNGRYDVYVDNAFEIKAIKQIDLVSKNIYIAKDFEEQYKDVYSEVIRFINSNDINLSNKIDEIIETNDFSQTLKIDDKEYTFNISYENVDSIVDENNDTIYQNENPSLRINQKMLKKVIKKFPQIDNIDYATTITFEDDNYSIYIYTKDNNIYRLQVYQTGKISVSIADLN
mgnify:CR=1 FL=1